MMSTYNRFLVVALTLLSIFSSISTNASPIAHSGTVTPEEITKCQLDEQAIEQLHEIRTERRHTRHMPTYVNINN